MLNITTNITNKKLVIFTMHSFTRNNTLFENITLCKHLGPGVGTVNQGYVTSMFNEYKNGRR